ncbi:MAG TPA: LysR family transcriptional regulator [Ramlibacter sp.]|nr:LysR family transcriptional regulator [Ramlibacter sp.]
MDINIPELKAFVAAARFGNFTRAAESLHISQPALSRRIGMVEHALGAPVFDRAGGRAQLTDVGEAFLQHAVAVLASLQDAVEAAQAVRRGDRGQLVVAIANSLLRPGVVARLDQFRQARPGIELVLHTGISAEVSTLVLTGDAALGVRFRPDPHTSLETRIVGKDDLLVVCAPDHPLASATSVTKAQLARETWIGYSGPAVDPGGGLQKALARHGIFDARVMVIEGLDERKRLVAANFGIGMFPAGNVATELDAGTLRALKVPAFKVVVPFALIRRKGAQLGAAARQLEELLAVAFKSA